MIKVGTYSMDRWNNEIMPLVEDGRLVEEKQPKTFLMVGQVFSGVLVDPSNKKRYDCTAWQFWDNKPPYVDVKEVE
jgi:hypothetical protein